MRIMKFYKNILMLVLFVMNLKSNLFLINRKPANEISKKKRMNSGRLKLLKSDKPE